MAEPQFFTGLTTAKVNIKPGSIEETPVSSRGTRARFAEFMGLGRSPSTATGRNSHCQLDDPSTQGRAAHRVDSFPHAMLSLPNRSPSTRVGATRALSTLQPPPPAVLEFQDSESENNQNCTSVPLEDSLAHLQLCCGFQGVGIRSTQNSIQIQNVDEKAMSN